MGLMDTIKRLMSSGSPAPDGGEPQMPASEENPVARVRRSISQQVQSIRARTGVREFVPSWEQEQDDPSAGADGPLPVSGVTCVGENTPLEVAFSVERNHLVARVGEGCVRRIALKCLRAIAVRETVLAIDLHVPLPVEISGELRAVHALGGTVDDPLAANRWKCLGSKHYRSAAECPYCFKTALAIAPAGGSDPLPTKDGVPYATGHCRSCLRNFHYDYDKGEFSPSDSPDARI